MGTKPKSPPDPGRFAYDGLDRVLHEKARLGIVTSLSARNDGLVFSELKKFCALTDGNLNRHLEVLADGGIVAITKGFAGKRPQTLVRLTNDGRVRFLAYLGELERVLSDARSLAEKFDAKSKPSRRLAPA